MQINKLIEKLSLGEIVGDITRVMGGAINKMYKVTTTTGTYAVKHLNPEIMKRPTAKNNHILAEKIANIAYENNIECLAAKIIDGVTLHEIDGDYFLIFDWFEGKTKEIDQITISHIKKVAAILAKIHNIDFKEIKDECNLDSEIKEVDWDFYVSKVDNEEIRKLLIEKKDYLKELDKKSTEAKKELSNDLVVSHRDLDINNILWDSNDNPIVIDWEAAGLVNPYEELIETAWDWSKNIDRLIVFINTYKENGGATKDLSKAIYSDFKNKSGWLEYNLKRACNIECHDNEEKELGIKEVIQTIKEIETFYTAMKEYEKVME